VTLFRIIKGVTAPAQLSSKELFEKLFWEVLSWWTNSFDVWAVLPAHTSLPTSSAPLERVFRTALLSWAVTPLRIIEFSRKRIIYRVSRLLYSEMSGIFFYSLET
jgi:hypothetical protein